MTFPVQQQPDLIQADELTLSNIVNRLKTLNVGQSAEYTQQRAQEFPTSGRYEPAYHAEAMACGVRLAAELHTAVMRAYYQVVREVLWGEVDRAIDYHMGAFALTPLRQIVASFNRGADRVDGMMPLPLLQIDTKILVLGPETGHGLTYIARGGVIVRHT